MTAARPLHGRVAALAAPTPAEVRAVQEAAAWYARLCSGTATEQDRQGWEAWRAQQPLHHAAWERVEAMQRRMSAVPGTLASPALRAAVQAEAHGRRALLRGVAVALGTGTLAWWGWRQPARRQWLADLRTGTGEQRELKLADGSQLALNTRTAVDLRFDTLQRLLVLHAGEIFVQTAPDPQASSASGARPFLVGTAHGRIQALGTRFLVRTDAEATHVTVLEKAVAVRSAAAGTPQPPVVLQAGQQLRFGPAGIGAAVPANPVADAWRQGSIVANDMPLAQLLAELGRYRGGLLGCDPAIAHLLVSGAFPVPDTDRALTALATGLPVRIETRTRYWVRVVPR